MILKRFQYYTSQGIKWGKWFIAFGKDTPEFQYKKLLRNEYKEVEDSKVENTLRELNK